MSEKLAILNDQPIVFFGKVVDQHNQPVPNAKVRGGVMVEKVWMGGKFVDHYTTTDAVGNFSFQGLRGAEIVIQPSKEGYEFRSDNRNFFYSLLRRETERHNPDASAPVVFTMWKQQEAESLISGNKFLGIKADGTPFTIDLLQGKKTEGRAAGGDLIVSVLQPASIADGQRFDWSFVIEASSGGLIVADGEQYLNEAPADGYEPRVEQELKATDREWSEVVRRTLFVKSRNGAIFARVNAELRANYQGAAVFSMRYLVNPKPGSRNLQYDPLKQAAAR